MLALFAVLAQETSVDQILAETSAMLEKCGITVPAGARYCEAEISFDGKLPKYPMRAKGWQLPVAKGSPPKFLALNGTVAYLLAIVKTGDLRTEVAPSFEMGWSSTNMLRGFSDTAYIPPQDITVALCYMAGEKEFAKQCLRRRMDNGAFFPIQAVNPVLGEKLTQTVDAFAVGNDRLAAAQAKWIVDRRASLEADALRTTHGGWEKRRARMGRDADRPENRTLFPFLDTADLILADSKRRLAGKRATPTLEEIEKLPTTEQAKVLIDQLENVRVSQMSYPGSLFVSDDPRVKSLVKLGDDAVEPLIDCIERDQRLTRSFSMFRPYSFGRDVLSVRDVARRTFDMITLTSRIPSSATGPELRAHWASIKNRSPEERSFLLLEDNATMPHIWHQAARYLLSPVTREFFGLDSYRDSGPPAAQTVPLRAHSLPEIQRRALSDLIAKRLAQTCKDDNPFELLQMLAKWDPPAARTSVRATFDAWMKQDELPMRAWVREHEYALLIRSLVDAGDKSILADYIAWLKRLQAKSASSASPAMLQPLVAYSDEPAVQGVMSELLQTPSGPFNLAFLMDQHPVESYDLYFKSPLMKFPEVRKAAIEVLRNRRSYGECTVKQGIVFLPNSSGMQGPTPVPVEYEGKSTMVRICDRLAIGLTWGPNMIHSYWPLAKRDEAIERLIQQLESNTFPVPTKWPYDSGNEFGR